MSRPPDRTAPPEQASLEVRIQPSARRSEVVGMVGPLLKIKVAAPPVEGAANEELVRFLAQALGLKRRDVEIVAGRSARTKRVRLSGLTRGQAEALLYNRAKRG